MAPDAALARLASEGSRRAIEAIYRRHHQGLYRYCLSILSSHDDALDALQSTVVKAMDALPGETREIELRAWLFKIAHNEAISIIRRRPASETANLEAIGPGLPEQVEQRAQLSQLVADLKQLPDQQRSALVMRELSGLSHAEIAAALGISETAAKQSVYESRGALAEMGEGRSLECSAIQSAVSAQDRRRLRSRKIRSHLRACRSCEAFAASIATRRPQLEALAPPLAGGLAAKLLASLFGDSGGGGAGGGLVAAGGSGALSGGGAKLAAGTLAVLVAGAGVSTLTDLGNGNAASTAPGAEAPAGEAASPSKAETLAKRSVQVRFSGTQLDPRPAGDSVQAHTRGRGESGGRKPGGDGSPPRHDGGRPGRPGGSDSDAGTSIADAGTSIPGSGGSGSGSAATPPSPPLGAPPPLGAGKSNASKGRGRPAIPPGLDKKPNGLPPGINKKPGQLPPGLDKKPENLPPGQQKKR